MAIQPNLARVKNWKKLSVFIERDGKIVTIPKRIVGERGSYRIILWWNIPKLRLQNLGD